MTMTVHLEALTQGMRAKIDPLSRLSPREEPTSLADFFPKVAQVHAQEAGSAFDARALPGHYRAGTTVFQRPF
jgi:hypothetical protein